MPRDDDDHCASCGVPWTESLNCPPCQDIIDEIMACPGCGGSTPDPGESCPACEEARDAYRNNEEV
jgi:hypothetical protein